MSGEFRCHFAGLSLPLVLRVPHQDSRQSRNDYDRLRPHHVLRQVPGHSRQRRPLRRLGRPVLLDPRQLLLPAPPPIVVRVPLVPGTVRASMPRTPALRRATRLLPLTHPWVRHEPAATLRTRALLLHAPTIAGPSARSYLLRPERPDGSFLASRPGSILASAEAGTPGGGAREAAAEPGEAKRGREGGGPPAAGEGAGATRGGGAEYERDSERGGAVTRRARSARDGDG